MSADHVRDLQCASNVCGDSGDADSVCIPPATGMARVSGDGVSHTILRLDLTGRDLTEVPDGDPDLGSARDRA